MGQVVDTPQQGEGTGCTSRELTSSQEDRFSAFVFWVNELFISPICLDTRKPAQQRLLPLKSMKNFETTQATSLKCKSLLIQWPNLYVVTLDSSDYGKMEGWLFKFTCSWPNYAKLYFTNLDFPQKNRHPISGNQKATKNCVRNAMRSARLNMLGRLLT